MKERDIPRKVELTTSAPKPKLESGDIFMPEPGRGDQEAPRISEEQGQEALENFKRNVGDEWSAAYNLDNAPDNLRAFARAMADSGSRPGRMTDEQKGLFAPFAQAKPEDHGAHGPPRGHQEPQWQGSEYTVVKPDGTIAFRVFEGRLTSEQAKEVFESIRSGELNGAMINDPEGFGKLVEKAMKSISDEDVAEIVKKGPVGLINALIDQVSDETDVGFSEKSKSYYRKRAEEISQIQDPQKARDELEKLLKNIQRQRKKVLGKGPKEEPTVPPASSKAQENEGSTEEEPQTEAEMIMETRLRMEDILISIEGVDSRGQRSLTELSSKRRAEAKERIREILEASTPQEQLEGIKRLERELLEDARSAVNQKELLRESLEKAAKEERLRKVQSGEMEREEYTEAENMEVEEKINSRIKYVQGLINMLGTGQAVYQGRRVTDDELLGALRFDPDFRNIAGSFATTGARDPEKPEEWEGKVKEHESRLKSMLEELSEGDIKRLQRAQENIDKIIQGPGSARDKGNQLSNVLNLIGENYKRLVLKGEKDPYNPVTSVQDLGKYLAMTHGQDLWGENGIYPIVDKDGDFHPENFIIWVREQSNKMHVDTRSDAISPLGSIHISTGFRDVSLYEMIRLNRQRYMFDRKKGIVLEDLVDEILNEAYGFGQIRNYALAWKQTMKEDKKLPETNGQVHARNDLTWDKQFRLLWKMSADYERGDIRVGEALGFANDIYYNMPDWEVLAEVIGGRDLQEQVQTLQGRNLSKEEYKREYYKLAQKFTFKKGDFEDAIRIRQDKFDWEDIDSYTGFYDKGDERGFYVRRGMKATGEKIYLFDEQGNFNLKAFVTEMNIYNYASAPDDLVRLVKELVRLKSAERYNLGAGIARTEGAKGERQARWQALIQEQLNLGRTEAEAADNVKNRLIFVERGADRVNIEFADNIAYEFQWPYGGAANNDVNRRGFNAQTKLKLEGYLPRQSKAERAGPVGVKQAVGIWRDVGPDMLTALRTETGESPLEILRAARAIENDPRKYFSIYKDTGRLIELLSEPNRLKIEQETAGMTQADKNAFVERVLREEVSDTLSREINSINNQTLPEGEKQRRIQALVDAELEAKARGAEVKKEIDKLRFTQDAESDIAGNVLSRGFQMFHAQTGGERIDLEKAVTMDPWQGAKIDIAYKEEHYNDGIIKPARYFGSTNGGMEWSQGVRRMVGTEEDGTPIYEWTTLAERSYSPEVLQEFARYNNGFIAGQAIPMKSVEIGGRIHQFVDIDNFTPEQKDYLDNGTGRLEMAKVAVALEMGSLLAFHREFRGYGKRWGYVRTEALIEMLESDYEIEPDPEHPGRFRQARDEHGHPIRFMDEKLIELVRRRANAGKTKLMLQDITFESQGAILMSLLDFIAKTVQYTVK